MRLAIIDNDKQTIKLIIKSDGINNKNENTVNKLMI